MNSQPNPRFSGLTPEEETKFNAIVAHFHLEASEPQPIQWVERTDPDELVAADRSGVFAKLWELSSPTARKAVINKRVAVVREAWGSNDNSAIRIRKSSKAAIDLASIMVGIVVIGVIVGVVLTTVFAIIPWAQQKAREIQLNNLHSATSTFVATCGSATQSSNPPSFCPPGSGAIPTLPVLADAGLIQLDDYDESTGTQYAMFTDTGSANASSSVEWGLSIDYYWISFVSTPEGPRHVTVMGRNGVAWEIKDLDNLGLAGYGFINYGPPNSLPAQLFAGTAQDGYLFN